MGFAVFPNAVPARVFSPASLRSLPRIEIMAKSYHRSTVIQLYEEERFSLSPSHKEQCEKRKLFLTFKNFFKKFFRAKKKPGDFSPGKRKTAPVFTPTPHPNLYYFFCFSFCIASTFPQNSLYFSNMAFNLFVTALCVLYPRRSAISACVYPFSRI